MYQEKGLEKDTEPPRCQTKRLRETMELRVAAPKQAFSVPSLGYNEIHVQETIVKFVRWKFLANTARPAAFAKYSHEKPFPFKPPKLTTVLLSRTRLGARNDDYFRLQNYKGHREDDKRELSQRLADSFFQTVSSSKKKQGSLS